MKALPLLLAPLCMGAAPADLGNRDYGVASMMAAPRGAAPDWADEFDGATLDRTRWDYDTARNREGWYNGEQQYYAADRPANLRVTRGRLIIEARHERLSDRADWGGQPYSSAKIMTRGHASWTYGFFEIRAKLPCARGTWPAIWMMPQTLRSWPQDGEIDIMEQVGSDPNVIHATLHTGLFNHALKTQRGAARRVASSCSRFHRYQLDWRPDSITIGIDGHGYMRVANDQPGGRGAWPFDDPFYLILNLAVGGDWAGSRGIDDAAMPQRMEIDYVRVWQRPQR